MKEKFYRLIEKMKRKKPGKKSPVNKESAKKKPRNKKSGRWKNIIVYTLWGGFIATVITIVVFFVLIGTGKIGYIPPIEDLENPRDKFASEIYSADSVVLGRFYQSKNNRVYVSYNEISQHLKNALIATEDVRFMSHMGVDAKALVRSFVKRGILMQKSAGGGSTITQQLAKLLYSPQAGSFLERLVQKPQEWVIAVQLERYYTKEEIINMYLNHFDFLNNAVGIQSAAHVYFHTTPDSLKIEEAATLVGMCKNPSYYNPRRFNERTRGRRNVVLDQMCKAEYITQSECDSLKQLPLVLNFTRVDHKDGLAPYFREHLRLMMMAEEPHRENYKSWERQQFIDDSTAWVDNPLYGWCNKNKKSDGTNYNIYTDGLKIYTTIDSRMQRYAEEAVEEHFGDPKEGLQNAFTKQVQKGNLISGTKKEQEAVKKKWMEHSERYRLMKNAGKSEEEIRKAFDTPVEMELFSYAGVVDTVMTPMDSICYLKSFLRAGFMSMDPRTGHVKAYVGGPNFANFQYNMVSVGRRQIGSTVKPLLYTLAMEEGFTPCDTLLNAQPEIMVNGKPWRPRNSGNARVGEMVTLEWALANSNNWISARLMDKLRPQSLANLMRSFGIRSHIEAVPSLCLGPVEVSVEEMVSAYTAFSNVGVRVDPLYVTRIEDRQGNVIAEFTPKRTQVMSEKAYYSMLPMLFGVVDYGTGSRMRRVYKVTAQMGAKTGTTNDNVDAWFMAFTPDLVSGMWVGGEEREIRFNAMSHGQGAAAALPIYGRYINKVYADPTLGYSQDSKFEIPEKYEDPCSESGTFVDVSTVDEVPGVSVMEDVFD